MGTNTENDIWIIGMTIGIYSKIHFARSCRCRLGRSFLYPGTGHIRILAQYTLNLRSGKIWSGVSMNYLEWGSLYHICYIISWPLVTQEEDPTFANLNSEASELPVRRDVNMKVSTVSWKPKARVDLIKQFVVRHKSGNFCSQFLFNTAKF